MTPEEIQGRILYRDALMLVINKPAGIAVHQSHPNAVNRDVYIEQYFPALQFGLPKPPMLAHRLDKDTSGCLVLGRHRKALDDLSRLFREGLMEKTYWAVVAGRPVPVEGRIDLPLKRIGGLRGERTMPADRSDPEAARAVTDFRTLDHAAQKLAWLELQPVTGRTHQLRVHCVAIRAPILGDTKYHEPDQNNAFSAQVEGLSTKLHLHARALRLPHPAGGYLVVEADLPPHMRETFETLGFHAPAAKPPRREAK